MQSEYLRRDPHAVALGRRGGQQRMAQLCAQERSALAKHAAHTRWHPRDAQAAKERAQEIMNLVRQALKSDSQLPLN